MENMSTFETISIISLIVSIIAFLMFINMTTNISNLLKQTKLQNIYLSKIAKINEDIVLEKKELEYFEVSGKCKVKLKDGTVKKINAVDLEHYKKTFDAELIPFN